MKYNNPFYQQNDDVSKIIAELFLSTGLPTKHATYQIVLPMIYFYCFKGKFRVRVCVDG